MGLDQFRRNPLSDFLGLEHCILESTIRNNPQRAKAIDGRDLDVQPLLNNKRRESYILQPNTPAIMASVPSLNLLASSALARDAYKASKKAFKSSKILEKDVVSLKNVVLREFEENLRGDSLKNDDITCVSCNTAGEETSMVFCATCQDSYHILCIKDVMYSYPLCCSMLDILVPSLSPDTMAPVTVP